MQRNTLHAGDCLPFLESLPDECVDALITDPPYGSGGLHLSSRQLPVNDKYQQTGTKRQYPAFHGDARDQRSHLRWSVMWLSECLRVLKPGAPVCVFSDWRQLPLTTDALQAAGFTWRGIAVWDKTEGVRPGLGRFRAQAEYIVWGSKGHLPADRSVGALPGVFRHSVRQADKHHLTGKPTDLMRQLVKICPPGGVVLDPFAGSGTTLLAAQLEERDWIGCEAEADYTSIASSRLKITP
jgi:site-specific DNA-methyltransferase (adenine-specific)